MDYLPLWLKVIRRISVGSTRICAIVSSLLHKNRVRDKRNVDGNYVAAEILSALQDKQYRDGKNDWVDVYELGRKLGFSTQQIREALSEFERGGQIDVVISTEKYVKLGIRGQMMRRP
jgi:hypothetical protein